MELTLRCAPANSILWLLGHRLLRYKLLKTKMGLAHSMDSAEKPFWPKNYTQKHHQNQSNRSIKNSYNLSGRHVFSEFLQSQREFPKTGGFSAESAWFVLVRIPGPPCAQFGRELARIHRCKLRLAPFSGLLRTGIEVRFQFLPLVRPVQLGVRAGGSPAGCRPGRPPSPPALSRTPSPSASAKLCHPVLPWKRQCCRTPASKTGWQSFAEADGDGVRLNAGGLGGRPGRQPAGDPPALTPS